ncbi:metallophosphoesterase [Pontibacillus sp. HMF3514]|uniref:metallophosphoesterase n=1 Tax=Pontibacillus sp. HMF3514 TaxID=2692425 RepID=UPI00131FA3E2|nr:metallophosphoesterase [Pontibacillus sp. HMF3514]QHE52545.1 metallophosphoesterase [Pontibacillus sp. HMF3514]
MYIIVGIIVLVVILLFLYRYGFSRHDRVVRTHFVCNDLPETFGEVRIFFISDIGSRKVLTETIESIHEKVDMVIIGGDLSKKGVALSKVRNNIKTLQMLQVPIFFVWGDRDYEGDFRELDAMLLDCNVTILANSAVNFESLEGDVLSLIGLDDLKHRKVNTKYANQDAKGSFHILATHNLNSFFKLDPSEREQIHVVLSGSSHDYIDHESRQTQFLKGGSYQTSRLSSLFSGKGNCYVVTIKST